MTHSNRYVNEDGQIHQAGEFGPLPREFRLIWEHSDLSRRRLGATGKGSFTELLEIIAANPGRAEQFRGGKQGLLGFFVGQVMRETGGKANPQVVNERLREKLSA